MNQFSHYIEIREVLPYETEKAAAAELMRFVDAVCYAVFTIRDIWGERLDMRGVVITPAEFQEAVCAPLKSPTQQGEKAAENTAGNAKERMGLELREIFDYLTARGKLSPARFWRLCRDFELDSAGTFCFFLAAVLEYDRKYERIYGYIQDNVAAKHPTLGLGLSLCSFIFGDEEEEVYFPERLFATGLLRREAEERGESRLSVPLIISDMAWNYLREGVWIRDIWKVIVSEGREQGGAGAVKTIFLSVPAFCRMRKEENRSVRSMAGEITAAYRGMKAQRVILEYGDTEDKKELEEEAVFLNRLLAEEGIPAEYGSGTGIEGMGSFCVLVKAGYGWEDLIMEKESKNLLHQICNQVEYKSLVREKWGFGKKDPYGNGISTLFFGPPGTGKTMAAQVIAGALGRKLYKVDVSRLLSKYIGETEKHVSALFHAAGKSGAVLFFDEADGLFAKRSEVGNSNDRYANMETGFLLQKLEEYDGISIMATNYVNNIDDAFKRRIRFLIRFPFPSAEMRQKLWEHMIPEQAEVDEDLRLEIPAGRFELSGSNIREVLIQAAYLAAAGGHGLRRKDIGDALKMHYVKYGKIPEEADLCW